MQQQGFMQQPVYHAFPVPHPFTNGVNFNGVETRNQMQMSMDTSRVSIHTHGHSGATTCQDGHVHLHPGVTSKAIETERGHVHKISGNTTFDDGHIHYYEAYTSPPIPLPNGYHTHYVEIRTTENDGHIHIIKGFTEPSKS
ncbi:hypothetical protein H1Z61_01895 [Bacillus aquiflavi]|uniref:YmaF family protein n=1 Tax=Bacillus aquiflavi TaxID=2672567 RepID=A0A6B3VSU9_9BACI|nr:YmaF family protein [Bacillus aquiflavi]MBA4535923.1 hypothetical protein [Bacillus aquiflavi]NEY80298.1 hypothetical protein [Bacillus aquiflavi]